MGQVDIAMSLADYLYTRKRWYYDHIYPMWRRSILLQVTCKRDRIRWCNRSTWVVSIKNIKDKGPWETIAMYYMDRIRLLQARDRR